MGLTSTGYQIVLIAHILCAIVGFGSVIFNGVYATQGRIRGTREALVIAEANHIVTEGWARWFIFATPLLGIVLVLMSHGAWSFGQTWVWLALALTVGSVALAQTVLVPAERKIRSLLGELSASSAGGCGSCPAGGGAAAQSSTAPPVAGADSPQTVAVEAVFGGASATMVATEEEQGGVEGADLREKARQLGALGRRAGAAGGVLHLSLVIMLYLMVFKPGA